MADFGPWVGDLQAGYTSFSVTPGATANTKGSWVNDNAFTGRGDGLLIYPSWFQGYTSIRTIALDVGMNAGSDILINNLMFCPSSVNNASRVHQVPVYFPIQVPAQQLVVRAQSNIASHGIGYLRIDRKISGLPIVGSVVDTYGAVVDASHTQGTTITAPNTDFGASPWVELTPSCKRVKALIIAVGHGQADWGSLSDQAYWISIGVGAAGSERSIVDCWEAGATSLGSKIPSSPFLGPHYVDIPEGSRISAQIGKQFATSAQRTLDLTVYGIR